MSMGENPWDPQGPPELTMHQLKQLVKLALMQGMDAEVCIERKKCGSRETLLLVQGAETSGPLRSALYLDMVTGCDPEMWEDLEDLMGSEHITPVDEEVLELLKDVKGRGYRFFPAGAEAYWR